MLHDAAVAALGKILEFHRDSIDGSKVIIFLEFHRDCFCNLFKFFSILNDNYRRSWFESG